MSDSHHKPSIPKWQQQHSGSSPPNPEGKNADNGERSALLEQASSFLQDDSIRDASTDRKIAFLESKGLTAPEIDGLLGVSRNAEASSSGSGTNDSSVDQSKSTPASSTETSDQAVSRSTPPTPSLDSRPVSSVPRDVPPIITYPEFLLHQSKPPPLVTLRSVLYTLYGAAGIGATIYGAGEYLVKPMLAALTNARHDLAQTVEENLKKLNEKLEQNVSQIPPSLIVKCATLLGDATEEDIESITSDPTELFHRDIGTQTSQDLTQPSSVTSASNTIESTSSDSITAVMTHQKRLETIGFHLRELGDAQSQSSTLHDTTRSRINDLHHYLDRLMYSKNSYPYSSAMGYGGYSTPGLDSGGSAALGVGKAEEDAISNFRAEIRGVKGALLSARNFPSGRSAGLRSSYVR
ncbi:peroxisomal membrane anchor protein conserved region-domain-containing protein [Aspergillus recurvatus]